MSNCRAQKLTREEAVNNKKNYNGFYVQPLLNQTQEETVEKFDQLSKAKILKDDKYFLFDIPVLKRVSEWTKRAFGLQEKSVNPDNEIKRKGGTFVHGVLQDLMNAYIATKGQGRVNISDITTIRNKALTGSTKMGANHFEQLKALVEETYNSIQEQQKAINKDGEVKIYTEQFVMDFISDMGGTLDVIALFSDNTASIYDYKTSSRRNVIRSGKEGKTVADNPFPYYDIGAYDLSMSTYKEILTDRIGVKSVRQSRLLPIVTAYKYKPKTEQKDDAMHIQEFETIIAHIADNDYMKPIPVAGEKSRWEGINKQLEKQYSLIRNLSEKIAHKGITTDEKKLLQAKIEKITKGIKRILDDEDILSLLDSIKATSIEAKTRLNEPKLKDGKENPSYVSNDELKNLYAELKVYDDIMADTDSYFKDIKKENPTIYDKLVKEFTDISDLYNHIFIDVASEMNKRAEDLVDSRYRDANGHLLPFKELSFTDMTFLKMSEINNPVFKTAWNIIQDAQYDMKKKFEDLDENVYSKTEEVFRWASKNNMNKMDAWKILINEKSGHLHSKLTSEFWIRRKEALGKKDAEAVKFFKDNYEIKNIEKWKKTYAERLEAQEARLKARFNNLQDTRDTSGKIKTSSKKQLEYYNQERDKWISNNDLLHSDNAWFNEYIRNQIQIKQEAKERNYSDEYKKIRSIKPLSDFYDMWTDYMEEFAHIFGITDYKTLPPNFVPNIRKEFVEFLNADSFSPMAAMKEIKDSLSVREEDVEIANVNEDGLVRRIPILFINKFFTDDGKVDLNRKSYDLSTSLVRFGKMAYNYEHMSNIEPKILLLKHLLGEPSPEQGGIQATDRLDRRIKGKIQSYLIKEGRLTETYKLFEDLTDAYLYGIRFKEQSPISGMDFTHIASRLKNFNSQLKLSFAILPASGAYVAGKFWSYQIGKKGVVYTEKQYKHTAWIKLANNKLYSAMADFIDPANDDYFDRAIQKHKASVKNRILNSRTGFAPLRGADADNMRDMAVSMMQNYGVNDKGDILRLNRPGAKIEGYTPIIDLFEQQSDGAYKIKKDALSKESYIRLRAAVKSIGASAVGNMNPDDIGRMETSLVVNQAMSFRTWMPAVVRERLGKTRWNEETQAMETGRFRVFFGEFANTLTDEEVEDGKTFYMYSKHVLLPTLSKLIVDLTTFGLAPRMGMKRVNEKRARLQFAKWQLENPGLKETVTYDDYLEAKEAQIKAALIELRVIIGMMSMVMFFAGAGDDGKPRYYSNFFTRNLYKIFSKSGSELTFMWNPAEFLRLMRNPFPATSLVQQVFNTVKNGIDESRDLVFGENSKQDKTPPSYYMFQWVYGAPQLMRFFEVYEQMKKNPYSIYDTSGR